MQIRKILITLSLVIFLLVGAAGVTYSGVMMPALHSLGEEGSTGGPMFGCPFMGVPALCSMGQLEHAFTLQQMLMAVPFADLFAFLILLLIALSVAFLAALFRHRIPVPLPLLRPPSRTHRAIPRHTLQEAFASGILHSKAFWLPA